MFASKLKSIFSNRCPQCLKGDVFPTSNPFRLLFQHGGECHSHCSHCQLKYEREVGFWYGAMYVSYAIGVAIFVATWIATHVLMPENRSMWLQIAIIVAAIVVLAPINYYLSRLIWINIFVKFKKEFA